MRAEFAHLVEVFGSQAEIARAAGVLQSTVSMWKRRGMSDAWKWRLFRIAMRRGLWLNPASLDGEELTSGPARSRGKAPRRSQPATAVA
jgi:hypothetical protein